MSSIADADVIIALFDGSRVFDEEDRKIVEIIEKLEDTHLITAINKSDLSQQFDRSVLNQFDPVEVSAKRGFARLTNALETLLDSVGEDEELMLISARQIEAVTRAKEEIVAAKLPLLSGELEFFSYHLQEAVKAISSISRPYDNEEILDKMFGEFCLGK